MAKNTQVSSQFVSLLDIGYLRNAITDYQSFTNIIDGAL
jgi:hypothetical protein